jgi:hypothetical protein
MPRFALDPPKTEVIEQRAPAPAPARPPSFPVPDLSVASSPPPALAFEEEPTRESVAPARPSREDLAALDALLNPSASIRSASSPVTRPRAERWEPQMRPAAGPPTGSRPSRRQRSFPVVPVAIGFGVLTAAGLGAWYMIEGRTPGAPNNVAVRGTPKPIATVPATTLPPATLPAPVTTPEGALTASPSTTAPTPPTSEPPSSVATPVPATPTPATPVSATPTPAATARPVPLPKGDGLASARQLLDRRDYVAAANGFAQAIRTSPEARYSVQLLVACSDETVEKALSNAGSPELLILPVSYKGRSCYRLCWGLLP